MTNTEIKWTAPEFEDRPKSVSWYWASMIVAALMIAVAIWQKNFLFGFFIVIAEILLLAWGNKKAGAVDFVLGEKGISIGNGTYHAHSELASFSVGDTEEKEWPDIFLQFKSRFKPALKIKVPKEKFGEIRKLLNVYLPEIEHKPSLLDTLEEFIGF